MSLRLIVGVISFSVATTGIILANLFLAIMIGEINRKRQDGNLVSYFGPKILRIFDEYRSSYPTGNYADFARAAIVSGAIGVLVFLFCIGISS